MKAKNKLYKGDRVKSSYRAPWTGTVMHDTLFEGNFVDREGNVVEKRHEAVGHIPNEDCYLIKVDTDRHGYPMRKPEFHTLHRDWLRKV